MWRSRSNVTGTNKMLYETAGNAFTAVVENMKTIKAKVLELESYLESNKVPFTPGRNIIIDWKME